jgi:hypothetical protein
VPSRPRYRWRRALARIGSLAAVSGCAYAIVEDGAIREGPMRDIVANTVRARAIEHELRAILAEAFAEWKTPAELADYERALVALGLWPADRELYTEALSVYGEEAIGIYLPSSRELLLVSDAQTPLGMGLLSALLRRDLQTEFALSHEIIHLLQHQAYPELMDPALVPKNSDDLEAAIQAALEGDAMRFGFDAVELQAPAPGDWAARIDEQFPSAEGSTLAKTPALIRLTFSFPYTRGYALAWSEGFDLLEAPPISTEQAMHDDRRREAFLQLDLSDLEARLPIGCRVLQRNTAGELQISVLFRDLSGVPDPAIWEGWNGDRYLVADCAGRTEWVWWTVWDSENDAAEFADAYGELAPAVAARAGSALPLASRAEATYVVVTSAGLAAEAAQPPPSATRVADLTSLRALLSGGEERAAQP